MLPSLAPASVSAFLLETVRTLQPDNEAAPLVEWLQALAGVPHAEALREEIRGITFAEGYRPLVSLVTLDEPDKMSIRKQTVFAPDLSLTAGQFGLLIFLELQAIKATREIVPFAVEETSESADGDVDEEDVMSSAGLGRCQLEDCFFPSTSCGAGFMNVAQCPHHQEDSGQGPTDLAADDERFPWTGRPFGLKDLRFLSSVRRPHVVGVVGLAHAGKTTLLGNAFPDDLSWASTSWTTQRSRVPSPFRVGRTSPVISSSIQTVRSSFHRTPRSRGDYRGYCI